MKMALTKIVINLILVLSFLSLSFASVEVFSKYDTTLTINSNETINVNKSLTLKNVYDVGIVPGQIEFKIASGTEGSIGKIEVIQAQAVDSFGNQIKTQVRETDKFSVIVLDVYYPLLPGFEYKFDLNYELSYEAGGIFFKSFQIPLRESTIPIETGVFKVVIPKNNHFTFVDTKEGNATIDGNVATWPIKNDKPKSIIFEYSFIPVPKITTVQGSYVFWIFINVVLLLILIYEVRREIKKFREQNQE